MIENGEAGGRVAGPVVREVLDAWLLDTQGHLKQEYLTSDVKKKLIMEVDASCLDFREFLGFYP